MGKGIGNGGGQHVRRLMLGGQAASHPRTTSPIIGKEEKQKAATKAGEATWRQARMTASCLATASTCQSTTGAAQDPGLAMHALLDLIVRFQVSFVLGSGVALAVIDDADCEPMQDGPPLSASACPVSGTAVSAAAVVARPEGSIHCSHRHVE